MTFESLVLVFGYIFAFYMAWNIGANDVANAMGSSVGAKAITLRQAVILAAVLNVVGAVFVGSHVTDTIRKGIVSPEFMTDPKLVLMGALSALAAAAFWVFFSTWKGFPVSTTHSIVGAMIGFGISVGGFSAVNWANVLTIVVSWIICPIFSLVLSFLAFRAIYHFILKREDVIGRARKLSPLFIGVTFLIVVLSFLYKTPLGENMALGIWASGGISVALACVTGYAGRGLLFRNLDINHKDGVENTFRHLQVLTACYVALSQGANDVANAIGPLAVIYSYVKTGSLSSHVELPVTLLLFGGVAIACGIAMWGYRVIETMGHKITTLTNSRGFSVEFGAATTILIASKLGLPVSTTHAAVGSIIGVGLAKGIEAVNFRVVFQIMLYWFITLPVSALTCVVIYYILRFMFL